MSFHDSELSDLLEKDEREALYHNVHEIVNYVQEDMYEAGILHNMPNSFSALDSEETFTLKEEILQDLTLPGDLSFPQELPPVYTVIPLKVCSEEYAGPYEFDVSIIPNGSKNPWVYSPSLNKVFIDMGAHFPVDFRVCGNPEGLFVRVTPNFSSLQYSQELVYRCVQHEQPQFNKDVPLHVRQHIIRCPSNDKAFYLGDRDANQRLSLLFPLSQPQAGTEAVREMFVFVCKSSCPTGMNRKPLEIIFTLEKYNGEILGRRVLNVRICSCPKRDKEKEEKDSVTKSVPQGKKRKLETKGKKLSTSSDMNDNKNMQSVTIEVPGHHNMRQILKFSQNLMAGEIVRNPDDNQVYTDAYKKLQAQLNQLPQ